MHAQIQAKTQLYVLHLVSIHYFSSKSYIVLTTLDLWVLIPLYFYTATNKLEQFIFSQENSHQPYNVPDNTSKVLKFIFNNS